ncbi:hypothetical protein ACLOJK_031183 [Asimina triloba]
MIASPSVTDLPSGVAPSSAAISTRSRIGNADSDAHHLSASPDPKIFISSSIPLEISSSPLPTPLRLLTIVGNLEMALQRGSVRWASGSPRSLLMHSMPPNLVHEGGDLNKIKNPTLPPCVSGRFLSGLFHSCTSSL